MYTQLSQHVTAARQQPTRDAARIESPLVDEEFDDFLDREIFAIRESLADFRNL
jgi:hypothetical protein